MIDFDVQNINEVIKKIAMHQLVPDSEKSTFHWQEWNIVYKEIRESLTEDKFEVLYELKKEILELEVKYALSSLSNDLESSVGLRESFIFRRAIDILNFVNFNWKDMNRFKLGDRESLNQEGIDQMELQVWRVLEAYLNKRSEEQVKKLVNSEVFKVGAQVQETKDWSVFNEELMNSQQVSKLKKKIRVQFLHERRDSEFLKEHDAAKIVI